MKRKLFISVKILFITIVFFEIFLRIIGFFFSEHNNDISGLNPGKSIMCFGDSFTYGVGVPEKFSYPTILDTKIKSKKVLNYGVPGSNTFNVYNKILEKTQKNKPLYIIILAGINNFWNYEGQFKKSESQKRIKESWSFKHIRIIRFIRLIIHEYKKRKDSDSIYSQNVYYLSQFDTYAENLNKLEIILPGNDLRNENYNSLKINKVRSLDINEKKILNVFLSGKFNDVIKLVKNSTILQRNILIKAILALIYYKKHEFGIALKWCENALLNNRDDFFVFLKTLILIETGDINKAENFYIKNKNKLTSELNGILTFYLNGKKESDLYVLYDVDDSENSSLINLILFDFFRDKDKNSEFTAMFYIKAVDFDLDNKNLYKTRNIRDILFLDLFNKSSLNFENHIEKYLKKNGNLKSNISAYYLKKIHLLQNRILALDYIEKMFLTDFFIKEVCNEFIECINTEEYSVANAERVIALLKKAVDRGKCPEIIFYDIAMRFYKISLNCKINSNSIFLLQNAKRILETRLRDHKYKMLYSKVLTEYSKYSPDELSEILKWHENNIVNDPEFLHNMAVLYSYHDSDYEKAVKLAIKAWKIDPDNEEYKRFADSLYLRKAVSIRDKDNVEKALKVIEYSMKENMKDIFFVVNYSNLLLLKCEFDKKFIEKALRWHLDNMIKDSDIFYNISRLYFYKSDGEESFREKSLEYIDKAIDISPETGKYYVHKIEVLSKLFDIRTTDLIEEAYLKLNKKLAKDDENIEVINNISVIKLHETREDFSKIYSAINWHEKFIIKVPNSDILYNNLSILYSRIAKNSRENLEKAYFYSKKALELRPDNKFYIKHNAYISNFIDNSGEKNNENINNDALIREKNRMKKNVSIEKNNILKWIEQDFLKIFEYCRANNIKPVMMNYPNVKLPVLKEIAEKNNVFFIDVNLKFDSLYENEKYFLPDGHLNIEGNKKLSEIIMESLQSEI